MTNTTTPELTQPPSNERAELSKIFESKWFWIALVLILFSLPLTLSLRRPPLPSLPVLGSLGEFNLKNQDGQPFGNRQLAGSVVLVNFVFTRCPSVCPVLTKTMSNIQGRLKGTAKSIQLVSITVDPDFDKAEVLKAYAAQYGARRETWNFLTGSKEEIRRLVVNDLKSVLESEPSADASDMSPAYEVAHGEHFVLIDQMGRIRAFERIQTSDDVNRILRQFAILVNTPPRT